MIFVFIVLIKLQCVFCSSYSVSLDNMWMVNL